MFAQLCYQGRPTESSKDAKIQDYGQLEARDYIPGAEVLEVEKAEEEDDEGTREVFQKDMKLCRVIAVFFLTS